MSHQTPTDNASTANVSSALSLLSPPTGSKRSFGTFSEDHDKPAEPLSRGGRSIDTSADLATFAQPTTGVAIVRLGSSDTDPYDYKRTDPPRSLAEQFTYEMCDLDSSRPRPPRLKWFDPLPGENRDTWELRTAMWAKSYVFYKKDPIAYIVPRSEGDEDEHPYLQTPSVKAREASLNRLRSELTVEERDENLRAAMRGTEGASKDGGHMEWIGELARLAMER